MKRVNLLVDIAKECLENGETGECLNQRSNVCVTKQGQSEGMATSRMTTSRR